MASGSRGDIANKMAGAAARRIKTEINAVETRVNGILKCEAACNQTVVTTAGGGTARQSSASWRKAVFRGSW